MTKNILDNYAKACQFHEDEAIDMAHHIAQLMNPSKEYVLESLEDYLKRDTEVIENVRD